jgi:hypothetical protein
MKTVIFKGKSDIIETNGKFKNIEILSFNNKIVTPLINFVYLDGETNTEQIDLNFKYNILYTVSIYFEASLDHECSVTYKLS